MKKIATLCLTLVMALSMSLTAFAAPGAFVSSPSGKPAPELVDFELGTDGCTAELKITPYSERNTLDEASRLKLEEAYNQIANYKEGNAFSAALEQMPKKDNAQLSVSDLFDISYYNCDNHEGHKGYIITLKADTFGAGFVGILHLNGDEWENIEVSDWNKDAKTVTFYVEELSPFAVVVDTNAKTGDNTMIYVWSAIIAVSGVSLIVISFKSKKKKA